MSNSRRRALSGCSTQRPHEADQPAPLRGAGHWLRRHRHPTQPRAPKRQARAVAPTLTATAEREHVNEFGHGGLPTGVVPAAVLGVSGHPAWWAAYTSTSQNPAAAAAASTSASRRSPATTAAGASFPYGPCRCDARAAVRADSGRVAEDGGGVLRGEGRESGDGARRVFGCGVQRVARADAAPSGAAGRPAPPSQEAGHGAGPRPPGCAVAARRAGSPARRHLRPRLPRP